MIRDRASEIDNGLRPLYDLIDACANDIGEEPIAELLNLWLRNHSSRPERDEFTKQDCVRAWKRQFAVCPYCNGGLVHPSRNHHVEPSEQTTCDHLTACKNGGTSKQQPVACHRRCNSQKGTRDLPEMAKALNTTTLDLLRKMKLENAE